MIISVKKLGRLEDLKDRQGLELIFEGGVDLTFIEPTLMDIQSCMAARYDAGIVKHRKELPE